MAIKRGQKIIKAILISMAIFLVLPFLVGGVAFATGNIEPRTVINETGTSKSIHYCLNVNSGVKTPGASETAPKIRMDYEIACKGTLAKTELVFGDPILKDKELFSEGNTALRVNKPTNISNAASGRYYSYELKSVSGVTVDIPVGVYLIIQKIGTTGKIKGLYNYSNDDRYGLLLYTDWGGFNAPRGNVRQLYGNSLNNLGPVINFLAGNLYGDSYWDLSYQDVDRFVDQSTQTIGDNGNSNYKSTLPEDMTVKNDNGSLSVAHKYESIATGESFTKNYSCGAAGEYIYFRAVTREFNKSRPSELGNVGIASFDVVENNVDSDFSGYSCILEGSSLAMVIDTNSAGRIEGLFSYLSSEGRYVFITKGDVAGLSTDLQDYAQFFNHSGDGNMGLRRAYVSLAEGETAIPGVTDSSQRTVKNQDVGYCPGEAGKDSGGILWFINNVDNIIVSLGCYMLNGVLGLKRVVMGWIDHDLLANVLLIKRVDQNGQILEVWKTIRNAINMLFLLGFLVMAFLNVLRVDLKTWRFQRMIPSIVGAILLVNLSLVVCNFIILVMNGITTLFVFGSSSSTGGGDQSLRAIFEHNGIDNIWGKPFGAALVQTIIAVAYSIGLLYVYALLWVRVIVINVLFALSAVPYIAYVLPIPAIKSLVGQWWKYFMQWAMMGPMVAILLFIAAKFVSTIGVSGAEWLPNANLPDAINGTDGDQPEIIQLVSAGFMTFLAATYPLKAGGDIMKSAIGIAKGNVGGNLNPMKAVNIKGGQLREAFAQRGRGNIARMANYQTKEGTPDLKEAWGAGLKEQGLKGALVGGLMATGRGVKRGVATTLTATKTVSQFPELFKDHETRRTKAAQGLYEKNLKDFDSPDKRSGDVGAFQGAIRRASSSLRQKMAELDVPDIEEKAREKMTQGHRAQAFYDMAINGKSPVDRAIGIKGLQEAAKGGKPEDQQFARSIGIPNVRRFLSSKDIKLDKDTTITMDIGRSLMDWPKAGKAETPEQVIEVVHANSAESMAEIGLMMNVEGLESVDQILDDPEKFPNYSRNKLTTDMAKFMKDPAVQGLVADKSNRANLERVMASGNMKSVSNLFKSLGLDLKDPENGHIAERLKAIIDDTGIRVKLEALRASQRHGTEIKQSQNLLAESSNTKLMDALHSQGFSEGTKGLIEYYDKGTSKLSSLLAQEKDDSKLSNETIVAARSLYPAQLVDQEAISRGQIRMLNDTMEAILKRVKAQDGSLDVSALKKQIGQMMSGRTVSEKDFSRNTREGGGGTPGTPAPRIITGSKYGKIDNT